MTSMMFSLAGKVAVVAGGGRGWLAALASYLAEAGADVAACDTHKKQMDEAVRAVQKHGRRALAIPTDITDSSAVADMARRVLAEWGKIDILVNNADLLFAKPLFEVTDDEWQRVLAGNLTPVFLCCRAVGKQMMAQGGGRIINISSVLAERGLPNSAAYCAGKGGVAQLTRALALEWARHNIHVNGIGVGWTPEMAAGQESMKGTLERYTSVRRFTNVEDISGLLVYLASDSSSYDTGQTMYMSGGVMAHG